MNFKDYQKETEKTLVKLNRAKDDVHHMVYGLITETGEITDAFKKHFFYDKDLDKTNVQEELGDLFWYISNLMRMLDIDFDETLDKNVAKLRSRYKEGFSQEEALHRDLDTERKILEGPNGMTRGETVPANLRIATETAFTEEEILSWYKNYDKISEEHLKFLDDLELQFKNSDKS